MHCKQNLHTAAEQGEPRSPRQVHREDQVLHEALRGSQVGQSNKAPTARDRITYFEKTSLDPDDINKHITKTHKARFLLFTAAV